ncbi:uncharacterized protein I303_108183 [Kwoniella dejecticola CBS 10117]|uniref:Pre-mRNA polyadenylation factor Fip1 domain-containing protein n=1 Tax=Kwoniella dejecticola CBS 10117 TaxID=1296121 RepID=A0AAJ8KX93_9TREE
MDIDDDDAFLYGDETPKTEVALPQAEVKNEVSVPPPVPAPAQPVASTSTAAAVPAGVTNGMTAAMAASLAAYGIEPSSAIVDNPEDGGVEEEEEDDEEDEDSDESDDDIKVVFTGQNARTLDLRKPQTAPSNVIGIGKWAHTATSTAPAAVAAPSTPQAGGATPSRSVQQTANQTTEYTPTSRPGLASVPPPQPSSGTGGNALLNPPISSAPTTTDAGINLQPPASGADIITHTVDGVPPLNPALPKSSLPPVAASGSSKYTGPGNGVIPSTGQSVFEIDMTQFEGSGQPWRKPGSVLSDYFNFGFDEYSFPRYLRYKSDMEKGRAAMMNVPPMNGLPPDVATLLHLQQQNANGFNPMMMAQQAQQAQQQQAQMQMMANQIQQQMGMMNPQMQAQMQQMMAMQGLDLGMMNQQMPFGGGGGGNMQNHQHQQQQQQPQQLMGQQQQHQQRPGMGPGNASQGRSMTSQGGQGPSEMGDEVKVEEGVETGGDTPDAQMSGQANPSMRGRIPVRGVPVRGVPLRGRGGAVPLGPRAGFAAPTGPKAGRFRDKDKVDSGGGALDYGGGEGGDSDREVSSISGVGKKQEYDEEGEYGVATSASAGGAGGGAGSRSHSQIRSRSQSISASASASAPRGKSQSRSVSRSRSASPRKRRSKREYDEYSSEDEYRERERERDRDRDRDRERDRRGESGRERDKRRSSRRTKDKDDSTSNSASSRSKRKREEGGNSTSASAAATVAATLGPGGWESEEEDERRSRRKRSPSEESEKRTRRSKRR